MRRESSVVLNAIGRRLACAKENIRPQQGVATVATINNRKNVKAATRV